MRVRPRAKEILRVKITIKLNLTNPERIGDPYRRPVESGLGLSKAYAGNVKLRRLSFMRGAMTNFGESGDKKSGIPKDSKPPEQLTGLYDNDRMKGLHLNKMNYGPGGTDQSTCTTGPKLTDLTIDVPKVHELDAPLYQGEYHKPKELPVSNENYQKIAREGTEFIAINGNINLQVKHALDEARQTDIADGTGHKSVDKLLSYMNEHLCGTYYSVARHNDTFMLLDSRDNHPNARGQFAVHPTERWNMATKKYENGHV